VKFISNRNYIHQDVKSRLNPENLYYHSVQNLPSRLYLRWGGGVKVKLSLCFFIWAPRHEGVLGNGGIAPLILWTRH
jgi:hypothetical protein